MNEDRRPAVAKTFKGDKRRSGLGVCEACGWEPPVVLQKFRIRKVAELLHAHHVVPLSVGGAEARHNLVLLCPNCHALAHATRHRFRGMAGVEWHGPQTREELIGLLQLLYTDPDAWLTAMARLVVDRERQPRVDSVHSGFLAASARTHRRLAELNATIRATSFGGPSKLVEGEGATC